MQLRTIALTLVAEIALIATATAQTGGSDLYRAVAELQRSLKPTVGQKPAIPVPEGPTIDMASYPIPLVLNGNIATLDSLTNYSLNDLVELRVEKTERSGALFGSIGSWGVIYVTLKNKTQMPSHRLHK